MKYSRNFSNQITLAGIICASAVCQPTIASAATITAINLGTEVNGTASNTSTINYQGKSLPITSFNTGATIWDVNTSELPNLTFQRSGNATIPTDDNKQVVWERCDAAGCGLGTTISKTNLLGTAPTTTVAALSQNNIYLGTDNIFTNAANGAGNQSDIERVDYKFSTGYLPNSNVGISLFERGVATAHDRFAVAAIIGFDSSSNPIYDKLIGFSNGSWGTPSLVGSQNYRVLNNGLGSFTVTSSNNQDLGGELIGLDLLVTQANTPVLGYSLFAGDTFDAVTANTCSITQLSSITNTNCFISGTTESNGGLDLLAANLGVSSIRGTIAQTVPEPFTIIGTLIGGATAFRLRKRLKLAVK